MDLVLAPDKRLRIKTKPVKKINGGLLELTKQMIKKTKTFKDPEGVGLASTQIGKDEQYFIAKVDEKVFKAFFNPKILSLGKKTKVYFEGCLSIPDYYGEVERSLSVKVEYQNEAGEKVTETLKDFSAWVFQHETYHLNGILFIDHVLTNKSRLFKCTGKDKAGADMFEEVSL